MKLTFIGVGSAFTKRYYQSNMLLESKGKKLLIDCGTTAHNALSQLGKERDGKPLSVKDINALYISHPHADHIGGLEEFALLSYFCPDKKIFWSDDPKGLGRPTLFIDRAFAKTLWDESLRGGLSTLQNQVATLETYFNVVEVAKNETFSFAGTEFQPVQVIHVVTGFSFMPSYGLIWKGPNKKVFLTTDAQHCPNQIFDFYRSVDIIFQDCETTPFKSGVHAHYSELKTLPEDIKSKMHLYHYADSDLPNAVGDGFSGFIQQYQSFDL